jgi:hypothetical protein
VRVRREMEGRSEGEVSDGEEGSIAGTHDA